MPDHCPVQIIEAAGLTPTSLTGVATALVVEFEHAYPAWTPQEALQELTNASGLPRSWVAVTDGRYVGCGSLLADDEVDGMAGASPWLGNVWVHAAYRGRGIGAALVDRVQESARSDGYGRLHLVTDTATAWYVRRGWSADGPVEVHGCVMTAMHLDL